MGGDLTFEEIGQLRREIAAGRILAPRISTPVKILDGSGGRLDFAVAAEKNSPGQALNSLFFNRNAFEVPGITGTDICD